MISPCCNSATLAARHSEFVRMLGCNCSFIIEKGTFIDWMAATGIAN